MQKMMNEWQNRLGLQDWRIKLNLDCAPHEMPDDGCDGYSTYEESTKTARIDILDPKYYGDRVVPFDREKILVHELLHLKLCLLATNNDDLQNRLVHQIIDDLARAFVDAKRSKDVRSQIEPITLESAISYLQEIGWMQEHDRILTERRDRWECTSKE